MSEPFDIRAADGGASPTPAEIAAIAIALAARAAHIAPNQSHAEREKPSRWRLAARDYDAYDRANFARRPGESL